MSRLYEAMQRIARDYDQNRSAAAVLFGKVKCAAPLEVEIDGKLTLTEHFLTVAEHLTDYEIPFELRNAERATHPEKKESQWSNISQTENLYVMHEGRQEVCAQNAQMARFNGQGTLYLCNHLRKGDIVLLLRMDGGHMYVVADRVAQAKGDDRR